MRGSCSLANRLGKLSGYRNVEAHLGLLEEVVAALHRAPTSYCEASSSDQSELGTISSDGIGPVVTLEQRLSYIEKYLSSIPFCVMPQQLPVQRMDETGQQQEQQILQMQDALITLAMQVTDLQAEVRECMRIESSGKFCAERKTGVRTMLCVLLVLMLPEV